MNSELRDRRGVGDVQARGKACRDIGLERLAHPAAEKAADPVQQRGLPDSDGDIAVRGVGAAELHGPFLFGQGLQGAETGTARGVGAGDGHDGCPLRGQNGGAARGCDGKAGDFGDRQRLHSPLTAAIDGIEIRVDGARGGLSGIDGGPIKLGSLGSIARDPGPQRLDRGGLSGQCLLDPAKTGGAECDHGKGEGNHELVVGKVPQRIITVAVVVQPPLQRPDRHPVGGGDERTFKGGQLGAGAAIVLPVETDEIDRLARGGARRRGRVRAG